MLHRWQTQDLNSRKSRETSTTLEVSEKLLFHFRPLASIDDLGWIDGSTVDLLFQDVAIFPNKKVDPPSRFVFVHVDTVFLGNVPTPVAQERKRDADLFGEGVIGERAIHAHTQDLGVGSFQAL